MLPKLQAVFGTDALGQRAASFLTHQLTANTYEGYGVGLRNFAEFCAQDGLGDMLDATAKDIVRYLAWLGDHGTVKGSSLQPYLSAINRYFTDHMQEPVALGPLVAAAQKGYKALQVELEEPEHRIPIPAPAIYDILCYGERLLTSPGPVDLPALRGVCAVVVNFIFCCRSNTGVGALQGDLTVDDAFITLYKRVLKGRKDAELTQAAQVPCCGPLRRVGALLKSFFSLQQAAFADAPAAPRHLWALPCDSHPSGWTSRDLTAWLRDACAAVGVAPPPGFKYSSHSMRNGAASAANAVGVTVAHICWLGSWSQQSSVVQDYISPAVLYTDAAQFFFGWLAPAHLRGSGTRTRTLEPGKIDESSMVVQN